MKSKMLIALYSVPLYQPLSKRKRSHWKEKKKAKTLLRSAMQTKLIILGFTCH